MLVGVPRLYSASAVGHRGRASQLADGVVAAAVRLGLALSIWGRRRLGVRWGTALVPGRSRPDRPQAPATDLGRGGAGAGRGPETRRPRLGRGQRVRPDRDLAAAHAQSARQRSRGERGPADPRSRRPHRLPSGPRIPREGEIQVRGPGVFTEYLNLPDKTREAFTGDGWFRTGDLGYLDARGFLFITGRADEMLVTPGGENVNPENVEAAFLRHAFIRDFAVLPARRPAGRPGLARRRDDRAGRPQPTCTRPCTMRSPRSIPRFPRISE